MRLRRAGPGRAGPDCPGRAVSDEAMLGLQTVAATTAVRRYRTAPSFCRRSQSTTSVNFYSICGYDDDKLRFLLHRDYVTKVGIRFDAYCAMRGPRLVASLNAPRLDQQIIFVVIYSNNIIYCKA